MIDRTQGRGRRIALSTLNGPDMARSAGVLFAAGALLSLIGNIAPHAHQSDTDAYWVIAALAAVPAAALLRWPRRIPDAAYPVLMVYASVVISLALYFDGERVGGHAALDEVLYVWVALYAGYFFSRRQLIFQALVIAALYGGVLGLIHPGRTGVTRWLIVVTMVAAVSAVVHLLRRQTDELVAELDEAARTDRVTGLLNRRGFDAHYALEFERTRRAGGTFALMVCDLDRLKALNDSFGHAAGDDALIATGRALASAVRRMDIVARVGGDEFALLLPGANAREGFALAARMREAVASISAPADVTLSISVGIAEYPVDGEDAETLMAAADASLYAAKGDGGLAIAGSGLR